MTTASSRQIELTAADWLARRDRGDWSDDDHARLAGWLAADAAHRVAFLRLEAAWAESGRLKALAAGQLRPPLPARGQWSRAPFAPRAPAEDTTASPAVEWSEQLETLTFAARAPVPPRRRRTVAAGLVAAAVLCGVLAFWSWRTQGTVNTASYASDIGRLRTVALTDGSQATLSCGSRIEVAMSRGQRRIDLQSGEAFFEAAKDRSRPFVVNADARRVVAVGTKFSVRRDGGDLRVVVTEGLVRLESTALPGQPAAPVTLLPAGSVAVATRSGVLVRSGTVADAERALDWRDGYLHFDDTPLAEAAAEFNRYGGRTLMLGDDAAGTLRIGGNFRWSNVDSFVRLLQHGFGIRAEQRGEIIVLHSH